MLEDRLTISANKSTRTQKASFSTLSSVFGLPSFACGFPHTVTKPSTSLTTICPTAMRLSWRSIVLLEKRTNGSQVKAPAYARTVSRAYVSAAIALRRGKVVKEATGRSPEPVHVNLTSAIPNNGTDISLVESIEHQSSLQTERQLGERCENM